MNIQTFYRWLSKASPEWAAQTPGFFSWLTKFEKQLGGKAALSVLEQFANEFSTVGDPTRPSYCQMPQWVIAETLECCRKAFMFQEIGDENAQLRAADRRYREDLENMERHLKGLLSILKRHDENKSPSHLGQVAELLRECMKAKIFLCEGKPGRIKLFPSTVLSTVLETYLTIIRQPITSTSASIYEGGTTKQRYGCLRYKERRTANHKKPTEVHTMLAAVLTTLFSHYRKGVRFPLTWTPVEVGTSRDHELAAQLINVTLTPADDSVIDGRQIKDRLVRLTKNNPGVQVGMWKGFNPP